RGYQAARDLTSVGALERAGTNAEAHLGRRLVVGVAAGPPTTRGHSFHAHDRQGASPRPVNVHDGVGQRCDQRPLAAGQLELDGMDGDVRHRRAPDRLYLRANVFESKGNPMTSGLSTDEAVR